MGITVLHEQAGDRVSPITKIHQGEFASEAGWTILGDDTANLTSDVTHVLGTKSLEFDKANGGDNTKLAAVYRTIAWDWTGIRPTDYLMAGVYCSALTLVDYAFIRIGTDASHYAEYQFPDTSMQAGWSLFNVAIGAPTSQTGNGPAWDALTYILVGVAFDAETNLLGDIFWNFVGFQRALLTKT